jgi:hypothetical protein
VADIYCPPRAFTGRVLDVDGREVHYETTGDTKGLSRFRACRYTDVSAKKFDSPRSGAVLQEVIAHAATTSRQGCRAFPARAARPPPSVLGVKREGPMTELYVFRGTTGHAEMVTDDKSGKKLPPHAFGQWVFSRTINVAGETHLIGDADCEQVLANVAKDGFHHWPELRVRPFNRIRRRARMSACPICERSSPRQRSSPAPGNHCLLLRRAGKLQRRHHRQNRK